LEGKYGDLIRAVWNESVDEITGPLRQQFDAKVQELNEVRHIFLSLVAELGSIKRRADSITYSTMDLMQTMPGKKMGVPSLATGIISRQDRYSGPIFIDYQECDKAFKKGVK
jgi:hypothetical protein